VSADVVATLFYDCSCNSSVFEPVCGADGLTYFSPCRAMETQILVSIANRISFAWTLLSYTVPFQCPVQKLSSDKLHDSLVVGVWA
jgi:hypothetical protein